VLIISLNKGEVIILFEIFTSARNADVLDGLVAEVARPGSAEVFLPEGVTQQFRIRRLLVI